MKFQREKLLKLEKKRAFPEELGIGNAGHRDSTVLQNGRQDQSYRDFTRLVMLSDFFNMDADNL